MVEVRLRDAMDTGDALDRVQVVLPWDTRITETLSARPVLPFSDPVLAFIDDLGRRLRSDSSVRGFPELVALGYWARQANIARLRARFDAAYPSALRMPRGVAFHIAPSNVDTIFLYSLLLSMLAGNVNIVRVSSRRGDQADLLMALFGQTLSDAEPSVRSTTAIIRYDHDRAVTDALSSIAHIRVVWGGDDTVSLIRESPLSPDGTDLIFPNKFSLAVFDADAWLAEAQPLSVARRFANDALWFGQMACSSPRSVVWRGSADAVEIASRSFWACVEEASAAPAYGWEPAHAVAKLLAEQGAAADGDSVQILAVPSNRVRVMRCDIAQLERSAGIGNGFFREARVATLPEFVERARPHWQTIVSYGIDPAQWRAAIGQVCPLGIDRIVPVGSALDFDVLWDGKDLLASLTRLTTI